MWLFFVQEPASDDYSNDDEGFECVKGQCRDGADEGLDEAFADDHFDGGVGQYGGAQVDDGGEALDELEYECAAKDDDGDADEQAEDDESEVVMGSSGNGQDVVQTHEGVCDDDGFECTPKSHGCCGVVCMVLFAMGIMGFEEFDGDPDEAKAPDEFESGDGEEPRDDECHDDPDADGAGRSPYDGFFLEVGRKVAGCQCDDDGVVACKDKV